jgi:hypothetical protein
MKNVCNNIAEEFVGNGSLGSHRCGWEGSMDLKELGVYVLQAGTVLLAVVNAMNSQIT